MGSEAAANEQDKVPAKSDAWTDLGLTLPIFLLYHLGVVFLPVRNAADPVTAELAALAKNSLPTYAGLTVLVGIAFVVVLAATGQKKALEGKRFALIAFEATLYAILMRFAGAYAVGSLPLAVEASAQTRGVFTGVVMSMGAGFYEEIAFRVGLFGLGALLFKAVFSAGATRFVITAAWAVVAAVAFSAWHYVGALGDSFDVASFVFRAVCGLVLTAIFVFRGFAPAVWTHALYDVWAMVLHG
ncbi:type II CAAX prenyl endopeptidase Rce1 family protein [Polyangium aurulentum]|uniref:CPBP family glutamic-type intramembrane protease n=1 Tax=Polyangium aurulentum TaxID=2567896 RepID=UPI0010AEA747|nr:CPBP family glutamic-type intramembrane protease [Polyangium aurulentum]UQA61319.1 CPBP family intramembrane metalloprotease [Polyangium aurulentum]